MTAPVADKRVIASATIFGIAQSQLFAPTLVSSAAIAVPTAFAKTMTTEFPANVRCRSLCGLRKRLRAF